MEEVGEGKNIDVEKLKKAARKINERLRQQTEEQEDKELKKAKKKLESDFIPRMEKYERHEKIFEGRNSFCKTDTDATFMRMKEDHMRNGQLKPGYNIQMGTQNQFILGFSLHRRAGDTNCLKEHLEKFKAWLGEYPENLVADAGAIEAKKTAVIWKKNRLQRISKIIAFITSRNAITRKDILIVEVIFHTILK